MNIPLAIYATKTKNGSYSLDFPHSNGDITYIKDISFSEVLALIAKIGKTEDLSRYSLVIN